jgi:hypothetical protein
MNRFLHRVRRFGVAAIAVLALCGCRGGAGAAHPAEEAMNRRPIVDVIAAHDDSLLAIEGVVGVYEGLCGGSTPCIRVMVVRLTDVLKRRVPQTLEGYPVELEATGRIEEMPHSEPRDP